MAGNALRRRTVAHQHVLELEPEWLVMA